ncbi:MAG: zinc ABC transporter substrate-binding protein [Devosia sp.]
MRSPVDRRRTARLRNVITSSAAKGKSRGISVRHFLLILVGLVGLWSVALGAEPIRIVAAENFYGDVAAQVGGGHVAVSSILSNPDTDPHLFEASPSTARSIADANIVITNGAGYDAWMDGLVSATTAPARTVLSVAELVGARPGANPHLWYQPATLPAVAAALAAELERRDPANAADYRARLAAFESSFASAVTDVATIRAAHDGLTVTATEPVFSYMATAMGFAMLNEPFQLAVMNGTEPGPSLVAGFEESLHSGTAKILFYNSQVTDDTTARLLYIAKANNIPVVGITETMPEGQTVQSWLASEIAAVRAALGDAP